MPVLGLITAVVAVALAARPALAIDLPVTPLPTVSAPALLPSPSLPIPQPSPSLAITPPTLSVSPDPTAGGGAAPSPVAGSTPAAAAPGAGGTIGSGGGGESGGRPSVPSPGVTLPLTKIVVRSPLDAALVAAVALLPLLVAIWLFVMARTWAAARKRKDARVRMSLAAELGVRARELTSLSTEALFKLREQAAFDDLTGTMRRAAGVAAAEREIARAHRHARPLTAAFIDLDGLKKVNDAKGHKAGDEVLRGLARALQAGLRGEDLVFRYGGDEFVCLLPDSDEQAAREKLRQIQTEAAERGIVFSAGFAELGKADDVVSLLGRADRRLYELKANGQEPQPAQPDPDPDKPPRPRVVV